MFLRSAPIRFGLWIGRAVWRRAAVFSLLAAVSGDVGAEAEVLPDPADDGWVSEALSEDASARLGELGELVGSGTISAEALASWCGNDISVGRLAPDGALSPEADGFFEAIGFRGRRTDLTESEPTGSGPGDLAAELHRLRSGFAAGASLRSKFKLFRIEVRGGEMTTRQFVSLTGPSDRGSGWRERNATWEIGWRISSDGGRPLMTAVRCEAFAEVIFDGAADGGPLFRDRTGVMAAAEAVFADQYLLGNSHWRGRIELGNRFYKFGQNGLAIGDVDGDGLEDVFSCQPGGLPNRLFRHMPDGTVRNIATEAGVDLLDNTPCALLVDLDNDGDADLAAATDSGILLYRNDGRARFELMIRFPNVGSAYGLTAADYNLDGLLDLYVCRYYPKPSEGANLASPVPYFDARNGGANTLIRNDGPGGAGWVDFSDATAETGLDAGNDRFSYGAVWDDLDGDGDADLYVANDFGENNLYLNSPDPDDPSKRRFRDVAEEAGLQDGAFGMSAATGDADGDGRPDIYVGNMFSAAGSRVTRQPGFRGDVDPDLAARFQRLARGNSFFLNTTPNFGSGLSGPQFDDISERSGAMVGRWSWGSIFLDFNNDGREDLFVANGFVTGSLKDDL